jgi:hypothetical protein
MQPVSCLWLLCEPKRLAMLIVRGRFRTWRQLYWLDPIAVSSIEHALLQIPKGAYKEVIPSFPGIMDRAKVTAGDSAVHPFLFS